MSEHLSTVIPLRTPLEQHRADIAATYPVVCQFCQHRYRTERGCAQHTRNCWKNPEATRYVSGAYDPILGANGRVAGFIWNGEDEHHRRRIRTEMEKVHDVLGLPPLARGKSHRAIALGPDPQEPCARCPEMRRRHADGPCSFPGCPCDGFIGVIPQYQSEGEDQ